ncbi:MAG: Flp pilus assembly complex ATPase component TadA [Candidatus Doudnabacteria bacterium]|nr:Flp pilus assembly complex ATPase component TadA [Candidatus Doudnabacteria bacterium]
MAEDNPTTVRSETTPNAPQIHSGFEDYLLQKGLVTSEGINKLSISARQSDETLVDALLSAKLFSEEELVKHQSDYFHLPYVDLRGQIVPREILTLMPQNSIANYRFVPFAFDGKVLRVALTNPTDLRALEALEFFAQKKHFIVEIYLTSLSGFQHAISQSKDIAGEVGVALEDIARKEKEFQEKRLKESEKTSVVERSILQAPISKIVDVIIRHAIEERASDIHIEPGEHDLRVRYRIDGILQSSLVVPRSVHLAVVSRIKILSNLKIDEQRLPQDGRFHMQIDRTSVDFRVSTLPTVNGEKIVLRILDKTSGVPTLKDLGVWGLKLRIVEENLKKPHGMMLVTGPTGSGKSTTLYSVLNKLNRIGVNIITLEDPVEYYIEGINQSQVKPEIGMTFSSGLRSILRQDPNIIMVGEIRDSETAELAVHAALTGHLVFSTLHTNDASGALPRLIDMKIDPFLIVASLNVVVAQRLVRRLCNDCKKSEPMPPEAARLVQKELANVPADELMGANLKEPKLYRGAGCGACNNAGYKGRIGIFEVLPMTKPIQEMILEKQGVSKIFAQAQKEGMATMKQDGYAKVLTGVTTIEEVLRSTKE